MSTKGLLCAAVVGTALLGCTTPMLAPKYEVPCNPGACRIPVHVENCNITAPDVRVTGNNVNMFWEIDPASHHAGYKFPELVVAPGVWIKDNPQGQFEEPRRINDWTFRLHDRNSVRDKFKYGVRVVTRDGTACRDLDPIIYND